MLKRPLVLAAFAAAIATTATADAARVRVGMHGAGWSFKQADQIQAWSNSPQSSISVDNRGNGGFASLNVNWQNLIAGSFLASPEGVVIASSRDGAAMGATLSVPPNERQQWMLNPNVNGAYRFAVIGDTRNPDGDGRTFGELSKRIAGAHVTFAIHLGNAVTGGNPQQMELFRNQLKSFSFPTYAVPGNHDLTAGGRAAWTRLFGEMPVSFKVDKDRFILLDNAFGTLTQHQHRYLESALRQASTERARHIFVFLHQPLVDPRAGINKAMTDRNEVRGLLNLFQQYKVTTVFAGHIPLYARERRKDVDYVTTGGGGERLAVPKAEGGYHHFVRVEVNGGAVTTTPVAL